MATMCSIRNKFRKNIIGLEKFLIKSIKKKNNNETRRQLKGK